jgi:hypothetical protein
MGLSSQGRLLLYCGRVPDGLALLDESMVGVAAGEVSVIFAGNVYCSMIEACQEIADFDRAARWTAALTTWYAGQPGLVPFTGQCAVHRGQIMRAQGAFGEALIEFDLAVQGYLAAQTPRAAGLAMAERGDVLRIRGDLTGAAGRGRSQRVRPALARSSARTRRAVPPASRNRPGAGWADRPRLDRCQTSVQHIEYAYSR